MATTTEAVPQETTIRDLLGAGLHFGHQTKRWNPKMKRYIFDKRNGIHIVDLAKSLVKLNEALDFVETIVSDGKKILFVGTKKQAQEVVKTTAEKCHMPYVTTRWLGGTLTNNTTIRKSVARMREIQGLEKSGGLASLPKKEASGLRRELEKLDRNLGGVADMTDMPAALFIVDVAREAIAVNEATKLGIPVVAVVDTNCNPDPIQYVIPGNDDAIRAITLITHAVARRTEAAAAEHARKAAEIARRREAEATAKRATEAAARKVREEKAAVAAAEKAAKQAADKAARAAEKAAEKAAKAAEAAKPAPTPAPAEPEPAPAEPTPKAAAPAAADKPAPTPEAKAPAAAAPTGDETPKTD